MHRRGRPGPGAAAEDSLEPLRDADQRVEVDPRLYALAVEEEDEILGGDVARCARRERAAAEPAHGRLEDPAPASRAAYALAKPVLRVLWRCTPRGHPPLPPLHQLAHLPGTPTPIVSAKTISPAAGPTHAPRARSPCPAPPPLEGTAERDADRDADGSSVVDPLQLRDGLVDGAVRVVAG